MNSGTAPEPTTTDNPIHAVFCGPIDHGAAQKIAANTVTLTQRGYTHIHLLFQSIGGNVGDGVFLYNLFRTLPIDLTLYNAGQVSSVAAVAYLGAKHRKTSAHATFVFHRTNSGQIGNARQLDSVLKGVVLDDERTERIVRAHVTSPPEFWSALEYSDVHVSAIDAVRFGIADEIADFAPPRAYLWNMSL